MSVVTLSLRIDQKIAWKWWVVMLPAFAVDLVVLVLDVLSIPVLIMRFKSNEDLDPNERILLGPEIMATINSILFIIAQVTLVLRLDHFWNTSFAMALLPYFIYALKDVYMPLYLVKKKQVELRDALYSIFSIIIPITILLCCLKYDGVLKWSWGATFIVIWIYFGAMLVHDLFLVCTLRNIPVELARKDNV